MEGYEKSKKRLCLRLRGRKAPSEGEKGRSNIQKAPSGIEKGTFEIQKAPSEIQKAIFEGEKGRGFLTVYTMKTMKGMKLF